MKLIYVFLPKPKTRPSKLENIWIDFLIILYHAPLVIILLLFTLGLKFFQSLFGVKLFSFYQFFFVIQDLF